MSPEDAALFCAMAEESITRLHPAEHYVHHPEELPTTDAARWFVLNRARRLAETGQLNGHGPAAIDRFLRALSQEHRLMMLMDMVPLWGELGAEDALMDTLLEVTGVEP